MLSCSNIRKSYGDREVVRGVTAQFKPGTISAIIGPSGTGKSTILRVLSQLESADSGSIQIDGKEISFPLAEDEAPAHPWPRLTTVFQQLFLWPHLTIRQNISLPVRSTDRVAPGGLVDQVMRELLVTEFADRYPNQVSHGQRQRAAIARAIALKPNYLLLDEVTSALDVEHVGIVLDYLQRLRGQGVAIVLITHLIGFARDAADQVIFMENGCIMESGAATILSEPQTTRLADFLSLVARKAELDGFLRSEFVARALKSYVEAGHSLPDGASLALARLASTTVAEDATASSVTRSTQLSKTELRFVAEAVMAQIRANANDTLSEDDANRLNRLPLIDHLRHSVQQPDVALLCSGISEARPELAGLFLSLLRDHDEEPKLRAFLRNSWANSSPRLKAHLMWRILDDPHLPTEWKEQVFKFVLEHWETFNEVSSRFLGPPDSAINVVLTRLGDPAFPKSKRWAYLCRVVEPAADKDAARAILTLHLNDPDEFTRHVARTLLDRFFPKPRSSSNRFDFDVAP